MTSERVVDYRLEDRQTIAATCPVCGASVTTIEQRGTWFVSSEHDLKLAAEYGITSKGQVTTIWLAWECSADPDHYSGPILLAMNSDVGSKSAR